MSDSTLVELWYVGIISKVLEVWEKLGDQGRWTSTQPVIAMLGIEEN